MTKIPIDKNEEINNLYLTIQKLTESCTQLNDRLVKEEEKHAKELFDLHQENSSLQLEISRLEEKADQWKATCLRQENQNVIIVRSKQLAKENSALKEDHEVFKTVITRLNREVGFYQEKLRAHLGSTPPFYPLHLDSIENEKENAFKNPKKILQPLLTAYDEVIAEKNEIIKEHEIIMLRFKQELQGILQENTRLRKIIEESNDKETVSIQQWRSLYDNAILVLEENDLLHKKIDAIGRKSNLIETTSSNIIDSLNKKVTEIEDEKIRLRNVVSDLEKRCGMLTGQIEQLSEVIKTRIPKENYEIIVKEFERVFEELKSRHAEKHEELQEKLAVVMDENERLRVKVTDLVAENAKVLDSANSFEKTVIENVGIIIKYKNEISELKANLEFTEKTVAQMMSLSQSMAHEKGVLERTYNEHLARTAEIMKIRSEELLIIKEFEKKINELQEEYERKIKQPINHAKNLEEVLETVSERFQAEALHLRELIEEKNFHIEKLCIEKTQLVADLESVWRATTRNSSAFRKINAIKSRSDQKELKNKLK